ncbi:MAG: hypothetical protein ACXWPM_01850 [Bdellovibrionota bacterium]
MSPRLLGDITNSDIIARRSDLAVKIEAVIDSAIHPEGDLLKRGEVLAKAQVGGKYRLYAEGLVTTAFAANSVNFAVDVTERAAANFKVGDSVEKVSDSTLLGVIATYDPATGIGTLTGNSAAALAVGQRCRLVKASYALNNKQGLVLEDETIMEGDDKPVAGIREGFLVKSRTALTASAISELGAAEETADEVRIQ